MQIIKTAVRAALAGSLAVAWLGSAHATFPGDNGAIVYAVNGDIFRVPSDGTGTPALIGSSLFHPAVAPDGKRLAAVLYENEFSQKLVVMNLDGSNRRVIDDGADKGWSFLAWSPDGKTLAHINSVGPEAFDIYLYDLATLGRKKLVNLPGFHRRISWSPMGDKLVLDDYASSQVVDVASGQVSTLQDFDQADWMPDYSGSLIGIALAGSPDCLGRVNADGTGLVRFPICDARDYPTVSPDGSKVLTSDLNPGYPYTYTLSIEDFQGNRVRTIATAADEYVDWSRLPRTAMRATLTNMQWSAPTPLANDSDTYTSQSAITVMPDNGAMGGALRRALSIGIDGRVYERAQLVNGNWGAWALVPGPGKAAAGVVAKQVAIAGALDGSVQAVIVASNDLVYHAMRYPNGSWSGFNPVTGANGALNFAARDVAIDIVNSSSSTPGQAHVVANGLGGGEVYHRVRLDDGNWTPWGGLGSPSTGSLAVAFAGNKDLYLLATTPTGVTKTVRHANGAWDSWANVSAMPQGGLRDLSLSIASDLSTGQARAAYVAYIRSDNQVWYQSRLEPALASSWTIEPYRSSQVMLNGRSVSTAVVPGSPAGWGVELVTVQPRSQ